MILGEFILDSFEYLYKRLRENNQYEHILTDKDGSLISNFLSKLDKQYGLESIGKKFIFEYLVWQFDYWKDKDFKSMKGIPLNWVLGDKAVERWEKKENFEGQWFHIFTWATSLGVKWEEFEDCYKSDLIGLREFEEDEKIRFWGSEQGLGNCINSTTLFNPKSKWCNICVFGSDCKELLKSMYLGLYNKRLLG